MSQLNGDMPAMPLTGNSYEDFLGTTKQAQGLTKRETFAMHAMQGLMVNTGRNGCIAEGRS